MKIFKMYRGLKREVYILCFGRFVTAMGGLIWPMLTLILKSKLGFNAEQVAVWFLRFGLLQFPFALVGGRLTDKYNKRDLIVIFDLISVILYVITAILPLSTGSLCVYFLGSLFQHIEWSAYDALIAELTSNHDREKAYSLEYLANNLGVVFAPTLGGLLFNHYLWMSFLIAGMAVLSSTILIYCFVSRESEKAENDNTYEEHVEGTLGDVIKTRKILLIFIVITCVSCLIYGQFNYLLPIQMDELFLERGAMFFGMLTSINGAVVICFTPILTQMTLKWSDLKRISAGALLEVVGLCSFFFYQEKLLPYFISMVVFTLGEILETLGNKPYISKRIPSSHRGRFIAIHNIFTSTASTVGNIAIGKIVVLYSFREGWVAVSVAGVGMLILLAIYRGLDKRRFDLLYREKLTPVIEEEAL